MSAASESRPELAHDVLRQGRPQPLSAMFAPRSIAVIGASAKLGSVGKALLENLRQFEGRLFPINPKYKSVGGRTQRNESLALGA